MKIATLLTIVFFTTHPTLSLGGSAQPNNLMQGLTPSALFNTTATYIQITAANTCLTALLATVSVGSSTDVYNCVSTAVSFIASATLTNFNTLSAGINNYNSLLSSVSNADSTYKKKYNALNATLTQRIKVPVVPNLYNNIVPNINAVNLLVANMSVVDRFIAGNLTALAATSYNFVGLSNNLMAQLSGINANLANSLANDLSSYGNNLSTFLNTQTPLLNAAANQVSSSVTNAAQLMANYVLSVPNYLNQILNAKLANLNAVSTNITNLSTILLNFNTNYNQVFLLNQTALLGSFSNIVAGNISSLTNLMSNAASSYNTILSSVTTLNNQINAILINLPFLNAELFYSQRLLVWAISKTEYDITNLLNYQMVWSSSVSNLFTQFDNYIIAENHFLNELPGNLVNGFNLISSTYNLGLWTLDSNANFPGTLTADQSSRCTTFSFLIAPFNNGFTFSSNFSVSTQNLDISYSFEAYLGYTVTANGIMGYVAVSDALAASGLLSINIEWVSASIGTSAVSAVGQFYGSAPTVFNPIFTTAF